MNTLYAHHFAGHAEEVVVKNGTVLFPSSGEYGHMLHTKPKKKSDKAALASVRKEMAKPRMARSAKLRN